MRVSQSKQSSSLDSAVISLTPPDIRRDGRQPVGQKMASRSTSVFMLAPWLCSASRPLQHQRVRQLKSWNGGSGPDRIVPKSSLLMRSPAKTVGSVVVRVEAHNHTAPDKVEWSADGNWPKTVTCEYSCQAAVRTAQAVNCASCNP